MSISEERALLILSEELPGAYGRGRTAPVLGIGDDAAIVGGIQGEIVWTIDSCEEGAHFLWEWMAPEDLAHKSLHAAVSDVGAMGATPRAALCHLTLGPRVTTSFLRRFARYQAIAGRQLGAPVVGGNLSVGPATQIVTTVIGEIEQGHGLLRSAAQPGDQLWLLGHVGLARAGLLLLQERPSTARGRGPDATCLDAFRRPEALVRPARQLLGRAHACLDVSDGLARDVGQLATSSGVHVIVVEELLRKTLHPDLEKVARRFDESAVSLALTGGEDYALLAAGPSVRRPRAAKTIGYVESCPPHGKPRAFLEVARRRRVLQGGFVHGFSQR